MTSPKSSATDAAPAQPSRERVASADNVIMLTPRRPGHLHVSPGDKRAVPQVSRWRNALYWGGVFGAVLVLHSAVVLAFMNRSQKPHASVGVESVSVEIVLGAQTAAGLASSPSDTESQASEAAAEPAPAEPEVAEETPDTPPVPQAEALKVEKPVKKPKPQKPQVKRQVNVVPDAKPSDSAAPATASSSGIGQGRSSVDSNYLGLVAALLAKHKRFPSEASASGSTGVTTVSFAIDAGGNFLHAQLVQSSGVPSLDAETLDLVRRASPFPPPPSGRETSFTVPVNFSLKK